MTPPADEKPAPATPPPARSSTDRALLHELLAASPQVGEAHQKDNPVRARAGYEEYLRLAKDGEHAAAARAAVAKHR